jgi:hypothetical protein
VKSASLKKRVLEALRLHNEVGLEPKLQPTFLEAGGTSVLIDILVADWPENSNFAASKSPLGERAMDVVEAGQCGACSAACRAAAEAWQC